MVGPKGELSKDLCNLIVKAATAAATKNWAELGEESSTLARAKYLRVLGRKIVLECVREQAAWMCGRFELGMQEAGGSGPSQRAKAQGKRSRRAQREYFDTHAGFVRTEWRRG